MRRVICNICKKVISEAPLNGRGGFERNSDVSDPHYNLVLEKFAYGTMTFDLCKTCFERLANALERGILEPDDLPELPAEENDG